MRKFSIGYVKSYFLNEGYTPLFEEYVDSRTPLKTECPGGHIYMTCFANFKSLGRRCPICSNKKKHNTLYVKNYFIKAGYVPLFDNYVDNKTPLKVMCPKGHICNIRFNNFQSNRCGCRTCYIDNLNGSGHHNWKGGRISVVYCPIWSDKAYKESIKERDNYTCQNPYCYKNDTRLHIHHIDYDKKNCGPDNLITVCGSCNSRANTDRGWHTVWYQIIMSHKYGYKYI